MDNMDNMDKDDLSLKFEMLIDHIIAKKISQPILRDIFGHSSGDWVNFRNYIDENTYIEEYEGLDVYMCWLNEINSTNDQGRLVAFFENNQLYSQILIFNMNTLKLKA